MYKLLLIILVLCSCLSSMEQLEYINKLISQYQQIDHILTQRRQSNYNYSQYIQPQRIYRPKYQNNKTLLFEKQLTLQSSHPSGKRSFIFFLKYNLYNAQVFQNITLIYYSNGTLATSINANIQFITIAKASIQYQLCYIQTSMTTKCGIFGDNIKNIQFKQTQLQPSSSIQFNNIDRYHVQKFQGSNLHALLFKNGEIRVYDGLGVQKPIFKSSCQSVVKYLDHNPYPMIIGTDRISFFEPFKSTQSSLGCPVVQGQIITAEVETPFSNTFYLMTNYQVIVMQYSLKKGDRHCKISHRIPISSPSNNLKMFYPTLIFNDSYINITDTLTPPQLNLPIPLCQHNQYQSQYRNSEYYLIHRCCTNDNCTSNIYLKSKRINSSSSKHFKYIILLCIFVGLALKFWNKKQTVEANGFQGGKQLEDNDQDPMISYQKKIFQQKVKKAQSM